ncbi:germination protein YpeB [Sporosalibacterium faouarense]|uniref:germination protein YpeB n=1 Tax=Sporosalibacterium faouarense TaxID=516123 RepID=UPI00141D0D43|nr:germination protein YpeB [Bacillota bacterium]
MRFRRWILPGILVIALAITGVWGYNQYKIKKNYETTMQNSYQRMFYDLKDHVENVQVSLSKVLLADSQEQNVILLSQIMQQAYLAEEKLAQLPISHKDTAKTEKFLNQVSDYSYALASNVLEGSPMDQDQKDALLKLQNYTDYLSQELMGVHNKLTEGVFNIGEIKRKEKEDIENANDNMLNVRLVKLEDKMTKSPELIYDGPFSDQVLSGKAKGLGDKKVDIEEAKKIAQEFTGAENTESIEVIEEGEQMDKTAWIPSYTFSIPKESSPEDSPIYIGVSKTGGKVVWMENSRAVNKPKISVEQAIEKGQKYLVEKGYESMESNYSLQYDGLVLINFAYKQNDVTIYTDLIKVKVALDTGDIVGMDAAQYLKAHHDRNIRQPELTQSEARGKVKTDFDVDSARLAIIPKEGAKEYLCYEFKGTYQGGDFIVYVDAITGKEVKILKIIKDENGTLTF